MFAFRNTMHRKWFRNQRDFDCEQVEQQTSQTELKHVWVVRLSEITPLLGYVQLLQAINNLAVTDDNKLKIVKAGALPHYVKLLSLERDETEQQAAARGLWVLAFKCKDNIVDEPGCLDGPYICLCRQDFSVNGLQRLDVYWDRLTERLCDLFTLFRLW